MTHRVFGAKEYTGKIEPVRIFTDTITWAGRITCRLNDTTAVRFQTGDYLRATPGTGTGLWRY